MDLVSEKIKKQVDRTRTEESSPKNTTLYFSVLIETKDLLTATMSLITEYYESHDENVIPATIPVVAEEIKPEDSETKEDHSENNDQPE